MSKLNAATVSGLIDGQREVAVADKVEDSNPAERHSNRNILGTARYERKQKWRLAFKMFTASSRMHSGDPCGPSFGAGAARPCAVTARLGPNAARGVDGDVGRRGIIRVWPDFSPRNGNSAVKKHSYNGDECQRTHLEQFKPQNAKPTIRSA